MKKNWNKEQLKRRYERILEEAERRGFNTEELESPFLGKLSRRTSSARIMSMISLAYYLGQLRAIQDIDEGYTPITFH